MQSERIITLQIISLELLPFISIAYTSILLCRLRSMADTGITLSGVLVRVVRVRVRLVRVRVRVVNVVCVVRVLRLSTFAC